MNTRRGLGRGLGALIPTAAPVAGPGRVTGDDASIADSMAPPASEHPPPATAADSAAVDDGEAMAPVDGATYAELPVDDISPNPRQPREVFDEDAMAELVASIREVGLLQPVVVRSVGAGRYELIMGERRWRATKEAGLDSIPAIVRDTSDQNLLRDALLENLHRAQLNPLEEAAAYQQLLEDFGSTHEELAARIGRSRPQITNTVRLLKLSAPVQRRVAAGVLTAGHARALLGVESPATQDRMAQRIVAEGLSVRAVEEIVTVGELGHDERRPRRRAGSVVAPRLADLAARLSERYDTRVKVELGRAKGRIVVEYASIEDLERLVELMDPREHQRTQEQSSNKSIYQ